MRKPKEFRCELSSTGTCQYGGNKSFRYGFCSGTQGYCRHPRQKSPLYSWLTGNAIRCPLLQPTTAVAQNTADTVE